MLILNHKILLGKLYNNEELKNQTIENSIIKLKKHPKILKILEDTWNEKINNGTLQYPKIYFVPHWVINGPSHQFQTITHPIQKIFFNSPEPVDSMGIHDPIDHTIYISTSAFDLEETFIHELIHYLSVNKISGIKYSGFRKNDSWYHFNELCTDYFARYRIMEYPLFQPKKNGPHSELKDLITLVGESVFLKWYLYGENDRIIHIMNEYGKTNEFDFLALINDLYKDYDRNNLVKLTKILNKIQNEYYKEEE